MSKGTRSEEERLEPPTATTLWCCPCLADVCCCCKGCYNCCNCCKAGAPCPFFYFCFPCCCCCCRPVAASKEVDTSEIVVSSTEAQESMEGMTQMESEEEEALVEETAGDEVAAAGVAGAAAASGGTGSASAAKPKARPRKLAKPAGKKAPKSSPTFFTGKAAGLPPPSKEACEGPPPEVEGPSVPVGMGAYLVYKDADGGKLLTQWSKEPLTGAGVLAYLRPEKEVGDYKFEKKSAIEVHATNCQKFMSSEFPADRIKFYEGWASFFKLLSSCGGSITLLPAAGAEPPPKVKIVLANKGKLKAVKIGQEVKITSFDSLVVAPSNAVKFDVPEMPQSQFQTLANAQGVYVSLKK
ncbi:uncharacterized protein LOC34622203 [Cyclospora cayetanensis]|uniref:Uncharacterized protein LOC34622203 n=1 Tax=Cyclospora cayetanensis TaxID=88456 RepID=A0A6P6RY06_9EIME|nr:uncharacterized protein LOC34622203 [Cyclospora cayetanensis]